MKITKKIIVLLVIVMGMLFFQTSRVEANEEEFPTFGFWKDIAIGAEKKIHFVDVNPNNYLYCVEKGQQLKKDGRTYEVIGSINIENNKAQYKNTKNGRYVPIEGDFNTKLAMAIATLQGEHSINREHDDLQYYLWGAFGRICRQY